MPALRDLNERAASEWLTREIGVTPIPISAFYSMPTEQQTVRFCFAKTDATLDAALLRLAALSDDAHRAGAAAYERPAKLNCCNRLLDSST